MATVTPNFNWPVPTSTDLVKDGATAIEALGDSIDASLVDLKGGTTGQVLAKASNTDLDYTWTSPTTGDITGVTAGTGISGGGTSGDVTITNSMATAIDAKGDLVVGTGADAFSRLAVGANGTVLTADSAEATGVKWAAAAGGGKVLQVVSTTYSTLTTTTSSTYQDSGLTLNITPSSSSSRIMIIGNVTMNIEKATNTFAGIRLVRGSTAIWTADTARQAIGMAFSTNTGQLLGGVYPFSYVDSPATTSATTYKIQFAAEAGDTVRIQAQSGTSVITLLEIGA